MRKIISYLSLVLLLSLGIILYSCSDDKVDTKETVSNIEMLDTDYENPIIGFISERNLPVLTKDKTLLLDHWNTNLQRLNGIDAQLDAVDLIELDGEYLLQASSSTTNTYSTTGAFVHNNNLYSTTTTCTTTSCSSTNGCTPQGTSCTACFGNCTKTVTSTEYLSPMLDIRIEPILLANYFISRGWADQIFWEYTQ